jgi:O-succinylbenzoate synthase
VTVPSGPGIGHEVLVARIEREASRSFDTAAADVHGAALARS